MTQNFNIEKKYFDAGIASSTATAKESLLQGLRVWLQTEVRRDLSSQLQVGIDKLLRFVMDIFKIILMKHYFLLHLKWTIMKQVIIITLLIFFEPLNHVNKFCITIFCYEGQNP